MHTFKEQLLNKYNSDPEEYHTWMSGEYVGAHSFFRQEGGPATIFFSAVWVSLWPKIMVGPRPLAAQDPPLLIQANKIELNFVFMLAARRCFSVMDGKVTSAAKTNPN